LTGRALILGLCGCLAATACNGPESRTTGTELLLKGMNSHRMLLTEGLLHEEIRVFSAEREIARGLEDVHSWLAWDSTLARQIAYDSLFSRNDTTWIHNARVSGVDLVLMGFAQVPLKAGSFVVHAWGGVREIHLSSRRETAAGDPEAREADFISWATHEYPQRIGRIWSPEGYQYSARGAADWTAMLKEWATGER
jgi:hypothetical protein